MQWVFVMFTRGKAVHSPPSNFEVNIGGAILPLLHTSSWHEVPRESFTFAPNVLADRTQPSTFKQVV
jgi:hypothetical protein